MDERKHRLLVAFELHSPEQIREIIEEGIDLSEPINGLKPVKCLLEMYTRSDRFSECLALLLQHGATLNQPELKGWPLSDAHIIGVGG